MPIRVYNRFLDLQVETDSYQSLQYERDYHGVGTFELHINRYMHGADNFQKGNIIALNKQENKAGLVVSREIDLDENGKESENFKITGLTLDSIMNRRVSVPPVDTAYDRKSGDAETVMKHYVYNHFVNPVDPSRKIDMLEIAFNQRRGEHVSWETRFKNIGEELENISIQSGLGWGVFVDFNTKKFIFDCFQAKNLTQNNEFGYSPVFFSPEFETIKSLSFIDSDNDLKNVGYVGGQGEGVERKIVTIGKDSGWGRIETFVDARDVGTEDEESEEDLTDKEIEELLIERGQNKMKEMETIFSLEAEILTPVKKATPFQYEEDFDLGDRVQVVNKSWGLTMTAPITKFLEVHEPGGFRLEATFGQSRPTIYTKLNEKFDELEGIEKQEAPALVAVEKMKEAMRYGDKNLTEEERKRIEQAIANLEEAKKHAMEYANKATKESEEAMKKYADAQDELERIKAEAYADGKVTEEEKRAIKDAQDKLEEAKEDADRKAKAVEQAANKYALEQDEIVEENAKLDAKTKADAAQTAAEAVAEAKAELAKTEAIANADGKITKEEQARIKQAQENLSAAKAEAKAKADAAERAANAYSETQDNKVRDDAKGYASDAEKKAKDFSKDASNIMEGILDVGAVPIRTSYSGARINFDGINGFVQYDKDDNPVAWFDLNGNARFSGDITGATGTFGDVTVTDGEFNLKEKSTGLKYSATPARNMIKDHSFELVKSDAESLNQGSFDYNWLDIEHSNFWDTYGKPKVATQFDPQGTEALPMFGNQAVVIRDANYIRQEVYEGIGAGSTYTLSAYFKRQWNVVAGGKPRFEVDHRRDGNHKARLLNNIFDAVPNDYTKVRRSVTFTVPNDWEEGDILWVKISGGSNEWFQCDGVQLVEGIRPAVYDSEDSTWEITKGNYPALTDSKELWFGSIYLMDSHTVTPSKDLYECRTGWILQWQRYIPGDGVQLSHYQYTYIAKSALKNGEGRGHESNLKVTNDIIRKYFYVSRDKITGLASNGEGSNRNLALTAVYEF